MQENKHRNYEYIPETSGRGGAGSWTGIFGSMQRMRKILRLLSKRKSENFKRGSVCASVDGEERDHRGGRTPFLSERKLYSKERFFYFSDTII